MKKDFNLKKQTHSTCEQNLPLVKLDASKLNTLKKVNHRYKFKTKICNLQRYFSAQNYTTTRLRTPTEKFLFWSN